MHLTRGTWSHSRWYMQSFARKVAVSRAIIAGIWVAFFQRVPAIIVRTGLQLLLRRYRRRPDPDAVEHCCDAGPGRPGRRHVHAHGPAEWRGGAPPRSLASGLHSSQDASDIVGQVRDGWAQDAYYLHNAQLKDIHIRALRPLPLPAASSLSCSCCYPSLLLTSY